MVLYKLVLIKLSSTGAQSRNFAGIQKQDSFAQQTIKPNVKSSIAAKLHGDCLLVTVKRIYLKWSTFAEIL